MSDFYDGPRGGAADLDGKPCSYESLFEDNAEDREDVFELRPLEPEAFALVLEDWQIWLRWEDAFYEGRAPKDTHPALPDDRARHDAIMLVLPPLLESRPLLVLARATFRPTPGRPHGGRGRHMEVRWDPVSGYP